MTAAVSGAGGQPVEAIVSKDHLTRYDYDTGSELAADMIARSATVSPVRYGIRRSRAQHLRRDLERIGGSETLRTPARSWWSSMGLKSELLTLVEELDRTHGDRFSLAGSGMPDFVTVSSGPQRFFTTAAGKALRSVATTMLLDRPSSTTGEPTSLGRMIREIYDRGRSQILHGTHHDRLKPFKRERSQAEQIASAVLLESALRLSDHKGDDCDKGFRKLPASLVSS